MKKLQKIYDLLLNKYGYQGWWPVTPLGCCKGNKDLEPIYGINKKKEKQKLEVMFGSILTQNTSWKNVEKAIIELNRNDLFDIDKILNIETQKLASIIKSSGYFNQKARTLKNLCHFLKENPIKELENKDTEELRKLFLNIKGIGPETADCILLYALEKPIFVIDAYTKRILKNLKLIEGDESYDKIQDLFHKEIQPSTFVYNEFHALLVEHAKNYYLKKDKEKDDFLIQQI